MFERAVKSKPLPMTGRCSPVGICWLSIGRNLSALIMRLWPSTSADGFPVRLKKAWLVRLMGVGASVFAVARQVSDFSPMMYSTLVLRLPG